VKNSPKLAPNPNSYGSSNYSQIEPIKVKEEAIAPNRIEKEQQ